MFNRLISKDDSQTPSGLGVTNLMRRTSPLWILGRAVSGALLFFLITFALAHASSSISWSLQPKTAYSLYLPIVQRVEPYKPPAGVQLNTGRYTFSSLDIASGVTVTPAAMSSEEKV